MAITNLQISAFNPNFSSGAGTNFLRANAGSEMSYIITYTSDDAHSAIRFRFEYSENNNFAYTYQSPYSNRVSFAWVGNLNAILNPSKPNASMGSVVHESLGSNNYRIVVQNMPVLPLVNGNEDNLTPDEYAGNNSIKFTFRLALLESVNNTANPVIEISSERINNAFSNLDPADIPELPSAVDENTTGADIDRLGNVGYLDEVNNGNPAIWYLDSITNQDYKNTFSFVLKADTAQPISAGICVGANKILQENDYDANLNLDDNFCRAHGCGLANGNINTGQNISSWTANQINDTTINVSITFTNDFISCVQDSSFTIFAEVGTVTTNEIDSQRNNVHVIDFDELNTQESYPTCGVVLNDYASAGFGNNSFIFAKEKNDLSLEYYSEVVGSVGDRFVGIANIGTLSGYSLQGVTVGLLYYTNEVNNEYVILESRDFSTTQSTNIISSSEQANDQMMEISFDKDSGLLKYGFALRYENWLNVLGNRNENHDFAEKNPIKFVLQTTIKNDSTGAIFTSEKKSPEFVIYDFEETQSDTNEPQVNSVSVTTSEQGTGINLSGNLSLDNDTIVTAIFNGTNPDELGGLTDSDLLSYLGVHNESTGINQRLINYSYKAGNTNITTPVISILNPNQAQVQATISKDIQLSAICDFLIIRLDRNAVAPVISPVSDPCCVNNASIISADDCGSITPVPNGCDSIIALPVEERVQRQGVDFLYNSIIYDTDGITKLGDRFHYQDECGVFTFDSLCCTSCNNQATIVSIDNCA